MVRLVRVTRGVAFGALAAGAAAALASMASFALFQSSAQSQTDTFSAGTVALAAPAPGQTCDIQDVVPGESGTCRYTVRYAGSVPAWVGLDVQASSVAAATYTPPGGATAVGGSLLLGTGGLTVTLSDSWGNTLTVPACLAVGGGATACSGVSADQLLADGGGTDGSGEAGAWPPGATDTVTVHWTLPLEAGDGLQGARAQIQLQAHAVQAADNPLVGGAPRAGWQAMPRGPVLTLQPNALAFGSVVVGAVSPGSRVTVANTGGLPTPPLRVQLGGTDPADFQLAADACAEQVLSPGATCSVTVTFAPAAAGAGTAAVWVDAGSVASVLQLSGTGAADPPPVPALTLTASRTAIGTDVAPMLVGGGAASASVTLTAAGAPVSGLEAALSAPGWTVGPDTCPSLLAAGAHCTLAVVFAPTAAGSADGLPTYTPTPEPGILRVTGRGGVEATLALTGTAAWGCTAFSGDGYGGCQLRGADFSDTSIAGADLSGAILQQADFSGSVVTGADLRDADLEGADLAAADLSGADLQGANLQGASLSAVTWNGAICPDGSAADAHAGSCLTDLTP